MAIVRNIQNDVLYRYLGDNKYRNLCTGKEGTVDEETAKKIFRINVDATFICENFPEVERFINVLNLKADVGSMPG